MVFLFMREILSGKINLRGNSNDKEFMKNVGSVLDLVLPIEPNVRVSNKNINIIWLVQMNGL